MSDSEPTAQDIVDSALGRSRSRQTQPQDDSAESIVARVLGSVAPPDPDQWIRDALGAKPVPDDLTADEIVDHAGVRARTRTTDLGFRGAAMRRTRARSRVTR